MTKTELKTVELEWNRARLRRQDQIRHDKERLSSPSTRLVGVEIFANSNFKSGSSWHSQKKMAESLGLCLRTVKRALPPLIAAGYIKVTKVGRHNSYEIILEDEIGDNLSPMNAKIGDKKDFNRGHLQPETGDKNAPLTLLGNSLRTLAADHRGSIGPSAAMPLGPDIEKRMKLRLGIPFFNSWCKNLSIHALADREITIAVPSNLVKDKLDWELPKVLKAFQDIHPTITRVAIIVTGDQGTLKRRSSESRAVGLR